MKTVNSISKASQLIRENLLSIKSIGGTYYFDLEIDDEIIKVRTSDHSGRSANNKGEKTFSFITKWNRQDCNINNEFIVDEDGHFSEEFTSIEDCLECNL